MPAVGAGGFLPRAPQGASARVPGGFFSPLPKGRTVPAGVFGTVAGWFLLPRTKEKAEPGRFDWVGFAVFAPTVLALLLGLSHQPWAFALAVPGGLFLVRAERRAERPLLPPSLLAR